MFNDGTVITLINAKSHGEGEDAMTLNAGTCGMVVQRHRNKPDGNHEYVVDFGPYGQWYCYHNELSGQEAREEGYDEDGSSPAEEALQAIEQLMGSRNGPVGPTGEHGSLRLPETPEDEDIFKPIDVEADIKRRMKEIENGSY